MAQMPATTEIVVNYKLQPNYGPLTWAGLVAVGAVVEAIALRNQRMDSTLSHATRSLFATHTPAGKVAFVAGWAALSAWFVPHIVREVAGSSSKEVCK